MKRHVIVLLFVSLTLVVAASIWGIQRAGAPSGSAPASRPVSYLALGDSVAAGLGLSSQTTECGQSDDAYPQRVAQQASYQLRSYACQGSRVVPDIATQLQNVPDDFTPRFITLTAGANDVGWSRMLRQCYVGICGTPADGDSMQAALVTLETDLQQTLQTVKQRYADSRLVVTGYYAVLPEAIRQDCLETTGLTGQELWWWREQEVRLNRVLRTSAERNDATFANLDFSGHDSCAIDPWVQGATAPAPFHPTVAGQAAIATAVLKAAGLQNQSGR